LTTLKSRFLFSETSKSEDVLTSFGKNIGVRIPVDKELIAERNLMPSVEKPKEVISIERLFAENERLKTNAAPQIKDTGVVFRTK
jgi:hypothetical protein